MDIGWVRVVHMIHSKLYEDLLMRVKYEWFKLNGFTLIFCPVRVILELMSTFLQKKTYKIEGKKMKRVSWLLTKSLSQPSIDEHNFSIFF